MRQKLPIVLSVTALLVAVLGFTSVGEAAKQALFPRNSVGSREIKNKSITGIDIKPNQIGTGKIKKNGVREDDIRDGSVTGSKVGDGAITSSKLGDKAVTSSKWAGGPSARAYNNANVSVPNGAFTAIGLNSERFDSSGMHDPATNNSRMTVATPGLYIVGANLTWANNTTGARELNIRVNGTTHVARVVQPADPTINTSDQAVTTLVNLAAGDYVEIVVRQNSGGALNVLAGGVTDQFTPELWLTWVGPTPS